MSGTGYDYSVTTFSPEGRVYQVEYAEKATEKTGTVIGIKCSDGIVLGVEKPITSKLIKPDANKHIIPIGTYASMAFSGIIPDGRALANDAKKQNHDYLEFYGSHIPGHLLAQRVAGRVHNTTIYWPERPFGVTSLLTVYDFEKKQCELYQIRPTGDVARYFATAIGRHRQSARTELEKIDFTKITVHDAVELIALILYKLHDDIKDRDFELELLWQSEATQFKVQSVPKDLRDTAVTKAKAAKERALMEDDDENENDSVIYRDTTTTTTTTTTATSSGDDNEMGE